jgi:outer membrane receptor protein involved in Fe transport
MRQGSFRELARALFVCAAALPAGAAPASVVSGVVLDGSGAPIADAWVSVENGAAPATRTRTDGRFTLEVALGGPVVVRAKAPGFAESSARVEPGADASAVRVVLQPAPVTETVAVTASRGAERLAGPESVSVLASSALLTSAAGAVDDALRSTPGFSLFRRSSSRVANPTTQGVTLRGVSGSGASRTLVLADGLPLNDAFGSWVYWNRIPQAAIQRVEVVRGAAGDLYGADALGGVVQILTFAPDRTRLRAIADLASHDTARASLFGSTRLRGFDAAVSGEWLATDGVPVVARADRGPVDIAAQSDYRVAAASLGREWGAFRAALRGSVSAEDRGNGTPRQVNSTDWRQVAGDAGGPLAGGVWSLRGSYGTQTYYQTFSAVAADRASERLTSEQRTPSCFGTASGLWSRAWPSFALLAGAEGRRTRSTAREVRYSVAGVPSDAPVSGGVEQVRSLFLRGTFAAGGRLTLAAGARGDFWTSDPRDAALPRHELSFFSPRASASLKLGPSAALHASAYRAHRTPTLNELHREFRVGNALTMANPLLDAERLTGAEAGALLTRKLVSARATAFFHNLDDAVANVTLRTTPTQITRQRQNAGRVRATGLEFEADLRPHPRLAASALVVLTHSRFRGTPALPALENKRVPQVPRYQFGASATYTDPRTITLFAQVRAYGAQFDDDINQFRLGEFTVVDASATRAVTSSVHAFAAVENVFDREYDTGRTPVRSVGWPRTLRFGLRLFRP